VVSKEILIHEDIHKVYDAVESTLRKTFKAKGELLGAEHIHKMPGTKGEIRIRQVVSKREENAVLSFDSFWGKDQVVTTYSFSSDDPEFTKVRLEEKAYSSSTLRNYNYTLMSLPILRSGSMKKIERQLKNLKQMIEGEN